MYYLAVLYWGWAFLFLAISVTVIGLIVLMNEAIERDWDMDKVLGYLGLAMFPIIFLLILFFGG